MKRILIATGIFAPDIGGPASYIRALGAHLAENGVQVTVLTYSSVSSHAGDNALPFRVCRVWNKIPWGIRHLLFAVRCVFLARRADGILALNAVSAGLPASWAARVTKKPLVIRVVGDYAWEMAVLSGRTFLMIDEFQKSEKSGRIKRLDRIQKRVCRRAVGVIVPSVYLADLVTAWGIARDNISVIYNGTDMLTLVASKEEARKHIGISGNIILSVGRMVPWKGFRMLIKLMPQLLQVNQFCRLVIVGDGEELPVLQAMVRNLGLERKVFLVGRASSQELAWYLAAADMFVLNTGYEGFSHQILEAMTAGVPVITTTAGGNREIVVQGENGFLVRYNDEFNLVEAIKTIWRQSEVRERLIEHGKQTAGTFSVERMYEETVKLFETIRP